ncbi:MAG TPA: hypothetical protein VMV51_07355 [Gemmatimonadaceae bacterium]|nr:hypothetical protein [Gemmatimonadaceae bacterium]
MYSTCLFCNSSLGTNEVVEHFPIGRRLAFDEATGRLWVVCRKCERWNLTPLDERWEAIEECERLFRDTKLRASTDNIGLAKVSEGLELVRIGRPQRPEMAAWRYGDQFGRRRKRYYTYAGIGAAAVAGVVVVGPALGLYAIGGMGFLAQMPQLMAQGYRRAFGRVKVPMPWMEKPLVLETEQVARVSIVMDDNPLGWGLRVPVSRKKFVLPDAPRRLGDPPLPRLEYSERLPYAVTQKRRTTAVFVGDEAIRVAGKILPKINMSGAGKDDVQRAVKLIEDDANPHRLFGAQVRRTIAGSAKLAAEQGQALKAVPKPMRLALEMTLHEETERRALEGELAMLEAAWKEADEIAGISDSLLLPAEVDGWLARLKRKL